MGWDNEAMFSDAQAIDGIAAITCSQSYDTGPLTDVLGRNIGVGTPLYIEVYGRVAAGATLSGTITVAIVTDGDDQLGSATTLLSKAALAIPTVDGTKAAIWKFHMPFYVNLERYIGLVYTATIDHNNNLLITAGVTLVPAALRAVGNGMNFN